LRPLSDIGLSDELVWGLFDAAPDGIVMIDESGRIVLVNRQVEDLFGYDRSELLGRTVEELLPEGLRQVHKAHRTRYRAEPRTRAMGSDLMLLGRRKDGAEFPVEISLSP
jgi:PAS domain S-box-containing protein